jgi:cyanate permease
MISGLLTGAVITTVAAERAEESAALVAVTVTCVLVETVGAEYLPLDEMLPTLAVHVTAVLLVLLTLAENCCAAPEATLAVVGDTETLTEGGCETVTENWRPP